MTFQIKIFLDCIKCKAAQLSSAPLIAGMGREAFKIEATNAIKDVLRRSRFGPVTVEGELVRGVGAGNVGTLAVSRIISAQALNTPPPPPIVGGVFSSSDSRPPPVVPQRVAATPPPASKIVAVTATEKAQLQLSITPQRAQTMMLTAPRGDAAPPNDSRGFIHKKIGGFIGGIIGPAVGLIPLPGAGIVGGVIGNQFGGGGSVARIQPCAAGFERDRNGNCVRSGVVGTFERLLPGGATGFQPVMAGPGCPSGMHPNRSSYFTRSEGFIEKGTKCVSNRRRNPLNPRAARRSMSRLTALSKEMGRLEKTLKRIAPRR